jgi:hypothetical protein
VSISIPDFFNEFALDLFTANDPSAGIHYSRALGCDPMYGDISMGIED